MTTMRHSKACAGAIAEREEARRQWAAAYPNHCRACGGWGGTWSSYDPSPAGVSLAAGSLADFDTCADCSDKGRCGRCGADGLLDNETGDVVACPVCGWNDDDGMPSEAECVCWVDELPEDCF